MGGKLKENLFVNIMMLLQVGAIGQYAFKGDWVISAYWIACLTINYVVTYGIR